MKIAYFHPYFYKGIVPKIRVRNIPFSAFLILLVKKWGTFLIPDYYQNLEIIPEPTIIIFHSIYLRYFLRGVVYSSDLILTLFFVRIETSNDKGQKLYILYGLKPRLLTLFLYGFRPQMTKVKNFIFCTD